MIGREPHTSGAWVPKAKQQGNNKNFIHDYVFVLNGQYTQDCAIDMEQNTCSNECMYKTHRQ